MMQPNAAGDPTPLSPERWARVRTLVDEVLALAPEARTAFLAASCGSDAALRDLVGRLAAVYERAGESWAFLAQSAGALAAPLLDADGTLTNGTAARVDGLPAAFHAMLAGRYAVGAELGRGGMATVYVAEDLRHHRRVALKVLDPELGAVLGAERFLAEIRVTAGLQHPNLLPLFDSGEAGGLLYYVMPLIDGATLRARLQRERQMPVEEAVRIACAVAGALDYAHRQGVIHRDLKPENVLLQDGQPLVADFGIALAVSKAGGPRVTRTGLSLGTPQYMSPEQATGDRQIDARSDIYSLAAVVYETLTGEPPHVGGTAQAIIARVLTERAPSVRVSRPAVPEHVDRALQRALEKLPADRWPTAAAFATALTTPLPAGAPPAVLTRGAEPRRAWTHLRRALPWAAVPLALVAAAWLGRRTATTQAHPIAQLSIVLPPDLRLVRGLLVGGAANSLAIDPDGSRLVLVAARAGAARQLFIRPLRSVEVVPIAGTEGGEQPFFSPDGAWIGFIQDGKLRKVSSDGGGTPVTITALSGAVNGLSWGSAGMIVFGSRFGPLMQVSAAGGAAREVARADSVAAESFGYPQFLPDGKTVLATLSIPQAGARLVLVTLTTGNTSTLVEQATTGRYVHSAEGDRLLYISRDGTVMVAPFDLRRGRVAGSAVPATTGTQRALGASSMTVALDGTFAFRPGRLPRRELVIREPDGALTRFPDAGVHWFRAPRFSPDGGQVAVGIHAGADALSDIWTVDLARGAPSRLTLDGASGFPEYTPDGQWISYASLVRPDDRDLLRVRRSGGTPETLLAAPGQQHEGLVTRDGTTLVYREINPRTQRDVWAVDLTQPADARLSGRRALAASAADEVGIALSPDGRWLAYTSNQSGRNEVYVRPVADAPTRPQLISLSGGEGARWDRVGRALYYWNADTLFSVAVERATGLPLGARRALFTFPFTSDGGTGYDVSPDGRRFVLLRELEPDRSSEITVVLHAFDAVDRRGGRAAR